MIWTSRIALIAYLLGGWLLPAAHHHAHQHLGACRHVAETSPHPESDHGGCGHAHDHEHDGQEASTEFASDLDLAQTPTLLICEGLCALCSARSLTSATLKQKPTSVACRDSSLTGHPTEPEFLPVSPVRVHLSRGPPVIA